MKYFVSKDTFFATVLVFLVLGILSLFPFNTNIFYPIKNALYDFDFNDLAFSKLRNNKVPIDSNIIIVNIENAGRKEIVDILQRLSSAKPRAIGVDVYFESPLTKQFNSEKFDQDSLSRIDSALQAIISSNNNIVVSTNILWDRKQRKFSESGQFTNLRQNIGYTNSIIGEERGVIRHFAPFEKAAGQEFKSFAAAVVEKCDDSDYKKLRSRNKQLEVINYTRTRANFVMLSAKSLLTNGIDTGLFRNRVVLVGYANEDPNDIEDKHFTPMNGKIAGKTLPDMTGVVLQANIISMILNRNYIAEIASWLKWLLSFLITYIFMAVFIKYYFERAVMFHLITKTIQVVSSFLIIFLGLLFITYLHFKWNMTFILVSILLSVDVIYLYDYLAKKLNKWFGYQSVFLKGHGH